MSSDFHTAQGVRVAPQEIITTIREYIARDPRARYTIIIGSDSHYCGYNNADFVTALVVRRVGNGGKYFWRRVSGQRSFSLRDRIIKEVMLSLETAMDLMALLKESVITPFDVEVHVDVGANGQTSSLISEVTGIVRAHNFVFKTKPESYAASSVADKHV